MGLEVCGFCGGEEGCGGVEGEEVEGVGVYFLQPHPNKTPNQKFPPFKLRLYDDEAEIDFGVRGSRLVFYDCDLPPNPPQNPLHQRCRPW